ncbi:MAG: hypothetical protein IT454_05685 [Planctomycetes bacterium]|nr:hypothetical protein [Planctomycetota bacterium]
MRIDERVNGTPASARRHRARRWITTLCTGLALTWGAALGQDDEARVDPPSGRACELAKSRLTEVAGLSFEPPIDRAAAAAEFLARARSAPSHGDDKFVLLEHACRLATDAGRLELALEIVDCTRMDFRVDAEQRALAAVRSCLTGAMGPQRRREAAEQALDWARRSAERGDFESALQVLEAAPLKSIAAQFEPVREASASLRTRAELVAYARIRPDIARLRESPDDPIANLRVGAYRAFERREFDGALPLLAKGSDPTLAGLAARDLAARRTLDERVALADAWLELADAADEPARAQALAERALHWMHQARAVADVSGTEARAALEARIVDLARRASAPRETTTPAAAAAEPATALRRLRLPAAFDLDPRVRPGAQFTLEFPDLENDRRGASAAAVVRIPERFDLRRELPLAVWLGGGEGHKQPGEAGKLADPERFVLVGLPYPESSRPEPGSVYLGHFDLIWSYHAAMLSRIRELVPNLSADVRVLSGFSNGGHCIDGLLRDAHAGVRSEFRAFVLGDGGAGRGAYPDMSGLCAFVCWGERSPNNGSSQAVARTLEIRGAQVTRHEQRGVGHAFTDEAKQLAREWLQTAAVPELMSRELDQLEAALAAQPGDVLARIEELQLVAEGTPVAQHFSVLRERIEADGRARLEALSASYARDSSAALRGAARTEARRLARVFAGASVARELERFAESGPSRSNDARPEAPRAKVRVPDVAPEPPRAACGAAIDVLALEAGRLVLYCAADADTWDTPRQVATECSALGSALRADDGALHVFARRGRELAHWREEPDGQWKLQVNLSARASGHVSATFDATLGTDVVGFEGRELIHFARDDEGRWKRRATLSKSAAGPVSLIHGFMNNLELVVREGEAVAHYWSKPGGTWSRAVEVSTHADGAPSIVLGHYGNLEVVVREGSELVHYWTVPARTWNRAGPISSSATGDASLTLGATGKLELVVAEGTDLVHYSKAKKAPWVRGGVVSTRADGGAVAFPCARAAR